MDDSFCNADCAALLDIGFGDARVAIQAMHSPL
jgi:hypothetical protein